MMNIKRVMLGLSAIILALTFSACNENSSAENAENTEETTTEAVTETEAPTEETKNENVLSIAKQGMFSSGGIITSAVSGEYDPEQSFQDESHAGNTAHIDHANVFYQIPEEDNGNPIIYLHGYRQSRMCWMTTPDGREGFSDLFLKKGYSAFLVDQPRRGEAGATLEISDDTEHDMWYGELPTEEPKSEEEDYYDDDEEETEAELPETATKYQPGDQAWYTYYRIGETPEKAYEGSQFPSDENALNQFFRQATPNTGTYDKVVVSKAMGEVMNDVQAMTGQKAIFMAHAEGCTAAWDLSVENLSAIIAIEPITVPSTSSAQYQKLLEANIPIVIYFGDYIFEEEEPETEDENDEENYDEENDEEEEESGKELASTAYWQEIHEEVVAFAEQYTADGGDCTVVDLPEEGIKGNSHFMFQEMNNQQIADHMEKWLKKHNLN